MSSNYEYSTTLSVLYQEKPKIMNTIKILIDEALGDLIFEHVETKSGMDTYVAHTTGSLGNGHKRYIILHVPAQQDVQQSWYVPAIYNPPQKSLARNLEWVSISTRSIKPPSDKWNKLVSQRWKPVEGEGTISKIYLELVDRTAEWTKYIYGENEIKIDLLMLHDPKRNTKFQYHSKINLLSALDSFSCVLSFQ